MTDHSHHSGHHDHDHAGHAADGQALSILRLSAFARLGWAMLFLIPLWAAVIWVIAS